MPEFTVDTLASGTVVLETACVGSCSKRYRIDEGHPEFARVKAALERGDRSPVFCYHKRLI